MTETKKGFWFPSQEEAQAYQEAALAQGLPVDEEVRHVAAGFPQEKPLYPSLVTGRLVSRTLSPQEVARLEAHHQELRARNAAEGGR